MDKVMMLLVICSAMTTLITEAIKKSIPEEKQYSKNILAGIVAVCSSVGIGAGYLVLNHIALTPEVAVYSIALIVLTWLTATLGYDKVVQTIRQLKTDSVES